jgi:hypothetical protein
MAESGFCFFHDPRLAKQRTEASRAGGRRHRAATMPLDTAHLSLTNVREVVALLGDTINMTRVGQLDPRVANSIGYISGILLKALETGNLEQRLSDLESAVRHQSPAGQAGDWDKFEFVQAQEKDQ